VPVNVERELAALDAALAELRASIAAPLRELLVDVLVLLTTRRALVVGALVLAALVCFGWFVLELIRTLT
jgi:hypothetical protein